MSLPTSAPRNPTKKAAQSPSRRPVFRPKIMPFYVPKMSLKNANGCSVCAWLLTSGGLRPAMRHSRIAALALRHQPKPLKGPPRLSFRRLRLRAGADQAHTLSLTNRPLNRLLSLCKITTAGNSFTRRKARRGAEPPPLTRSGSAAAFPRRVRVFHIRLRDFQLIRTAIVRRYTHIPKILFQNHSPI